MSTQYRLVHKLGVGGMAEVYLAQQQGIAGFEKLVVVKRILPQLREDAEFVNMLLAEARLAAGLRHPNIVEIYDVRRDGGEFLIVMEYLAGEDLRFILNSARNDEFQVPVGVSGRIVSDAAAGLDFAHRATDRHGRPLGVVHRDVGPTNIMLTYHGVGKLLDFGVAKANIHNIYTRPGTLKGKYGYSSPEQVRHRTLDARSDVFSLGIVLHEMLTGRRLFKGRTPPETLKAVMEAPIVAPSRVNPEVPPELDEVALRALQRNRSERYPSAAHMQEQLELALEKNGLLIDHHAVSSWMTTALAEARDQRRALEASVARDVEVSGVRSELPGPIANAAASYGSAPAPSASHISSPSQHSSQHSWHGSGAPPSWQSSGLHSQTAPPPQRRVGLIILLSSLLTLLVILLVGLSFWIGKEGNRGEVVEVVKPNGPAAKTQVALHLHVVPLGASLTVDGEAWPYPIDEAGVLVPRDAGAGTELVVSKEGFQSERRAIVAPGTGTQNVYITLRRVAIDAAVVAEADPTPAPEPEPSGSSRASPRRRTSRSSRASTSPSPGRLELAVQPANAKVFVDGKPYPGGPSRQVAGLSPGTHQLTVEAPGFESIARSFEVEASSASKLSVGLEKAAPAPAVIDITSNPSGAEVLVDGRPRGSSPVLGLQLAAKTSHKIELRQAGYEAWTTKIEPDSGTNPAVRATLKKASAPAATTPTEATTKAPAPAPARGLAIPKSMVGAAGPGRTLFRDRCLGCHDGSKASKVGTSRYTQAQWTRYFSRARHRRHAPLSETFNRTELADVKAYLLSAAADVESGTAAGVR